MRNSEAFARSWTRNKPTHALERRTTVDPLRTIIMRDVCIVFVPEGADSLVSVLKDKFRELMTEKEESEETPFEFRCSKTCGVNTCRLFVQTLEYVG